MKVFVNPEKETWSSICARPEIDAEFLGDKVKSILQEVKESGDKALKFYTKLFDHVDLEIIEVTEAEKISAVKELDNDLKAAIQKAGDNILRFHKSQKEFFTPIETMPGVLCWRKSIGIEKVGLYIPGGTAPLFSTVLMLAIPAKIAGCKEIILCSPPRNDGSLHPAIIYAADQAGVDRIYKLGGVQAIGAMAYGTETVPKVYKIFGPGNQYVTMAKQMVNLSGTAIDLPAGPSEVLVCMDHTAEPSFVAADLLSQAEHGTDSQVILVAFTENQISEVLNELQLQLKKLPRREIAEKALENSTAVVFDKISTAVLFINEYAPEHLILSIENCDSIADDIINAGSIFLGNFTPESVGDYASGTNHTLPTAGFAKAYSGVSLDSFVKKITIQKLNEHGIMNLGPIVEKLATAEALAAHKEAVSIRLKKLK